MKSPPPRHDPRRPDPTGRFSKLSKLSTAWLNWKEAADWVHEQEKRRAAEQQRFAADRLRLELEALWQLPTRTVSRPLDE
jgi:hypothetical protein